MQKIGVAIGLDTSDLVANAERAKSSLESLHRAMDSSLKAGNLEDVKNYAAANLEARNQFARDAQIGGYSDKVTLDTGQLQEHIKNLEAAMNQKITEGKSGEAKEYTSLLNSYRSQFTAEKGDSENHKFENTMAQLINSGDMASVRSQLDLRKQFIHDARIGGDSEIKLDSGPLEAVIRELKDAINRAISEGKTDDAKRYGSIVKDFQKQLDFEQGGDDREKQFNQNQQMRTLRTLTRFLNAQNVIGSAGAGNVAGAALGAAGGVGDFVSQLPKGALIGGAVIGGVVALGAAANKLSEQWEKMMEPSMGLAAAMGRLGDDADKNHATFQEVFAQAADRRVLHGYKLEEGIALANQLSKSGMAADNVIGGEEQVFRYQRMTDADRGTLAQAVGYAGRYRNNENVLGYAFGGTKASGMERGQYQEYLNATLRIFEEGLSKGVVKGFAEITRTQNMLAMIGDTWKGERGVEKYERMNDSVAGAYNLRSDYDVILYNAARNLNGGKGDYIETAKILDRGLTPELLGEYHKILEESITGGDDKSGIMQYMRTFKLNATAAEEVYNFVKDEKWKEAVEKIEEPDSKAVDNTPEGILLSATESIRADIANIGAWFTSPKADIVDAISRLTGFMAGDVIFKAHDQSNTDALESLGIPDDEINRLNRLYHEAYTRDNQPDADDSLMGDWGESASRMQDRIAGLPIGA
ncbi:MAG: hypothetical protein LBP74_10755, partial [Treponema sp.]|nr:hypothetical protein [Treponema sp.]